MRLLLIAIVVGLAGCAALDEEERVANLEGGALKKHCKNISGDYACGTPDGFEITSTWDEDDCVENITDRYAACPMTVEEQQSCVDAIRACDDPEALKQEDNVCVPWIECIATANN